MCCNYRKVTMSDYINAAYTKVCQEAESSEDRFVSLYESHRYYGGPEEGGWYGTDRRLVKTARFSSQSTADRVAERITKLAEEMTAESKRAWAEQRSRECDWCEARGLDADYLPEPDGGTEYFVVIENVAGSRESRGPRYYE
jgi:hypothetical protein